MTREVEIRKRLEAATPGELSADEVNGMLRCHYGAGEDDFDYLAEVYGDNKVNNLLVYANAPADLRYLLEKVERLENAIREHKAAVSDKPTADVYHTTDRRLWVHIEREPA